MTDGGVQDCLEIPETFGEATNAVSAILKAAGIESARLDARLLVAHGADVPPETVLTRPELVLNERIRARIAELLRRRAEREPMSHILGEREFWSMAFAVTSDTLTPRPDTECLVEAVLSAWSREKRDAAPRILDLGTGTGCILLALMSELSSSTGIGVDISDSALAIAQQNAERHELDQRVQFLKGEWFEPAAGSFDLIVSNPPYIETTEIVALEPEVAHFEPRLALDGGPDGLEPYRQICAEVMAYLVPGGVVGFEIGATQAGAVRALMEGAGLSSSQIIADLAGRDRVVLATRKD